jgi:hypothetical protein
VLSNSKFPVIENINMLMNHKFFGELYEWMKKELENINENDLSLLMILH